MECWRKDITNVQEKSQKDEEIQVVGYILVEAKHKIKGYTRLTHAMLDLQYEGDGLGKDKCNMIRPIE